MDVAVEQLRTVRVLRRGPSRTLSTGLRVGLLAQVREETQPDAGLAGRPGRCRADV